MQNVTRGAPSAGLAAFDQIYRQHVGAVAAYFARRSADPQSVAQLTYETFDSAARAFGDFDSCKASPRAWLFGIATRVAGRERGADADRTQDPTTLRAYRPLSVNEADELAAMIGAQRGARRLLRRHAGLPALELAAVELVDVAGLTPEEAAAALGVYPSVLRRRLSRARTQYREEAASDD